MWSEPSRGGVGEASFRSPHIPLSWGLKRLKQHCPGSLWTSKTITFSNHYQIRARKQQGSLCLDPPGPPVPPRQTQANAIQTSPSRTALPPRGPSPDGHRSSEVSVLQVTRPLFHRPRERPASRDFLATQGVLYSSPAEANFKRASGGASPSYRWYNSDLQWPS